MSAVEQYALQLHPLADCSNCFRQTTGRVWEHGSLRPLCVSCLLAIYR
jgi:hypothetical protein